MKSETPKVIDLHKRRYAKTVMYFYDKMDRAMKRDQREHKAEVERENRKKW